MPSPAPRRYSKRVCGKPCIFFPQIQAKGPPSSRRSVVVRERGVGVRHVELVDLAAALQFGSAGNARRVAALRDPGSCTRPCAWALGRRGGWRPRYRLDMCGGTYPRACSRPPYLRVLSFSPIASISSQRICRTPVQLTPSIDPRHASWQLPPRAHPVRSNM